MALRKLLRVLTSHSLTASTMILTAPDVESVTIFRKSSQSAEKEFARLGPSNSNRFLTVLNLGNGAKSRKTTYVVGF